ncbi:MAG: pyridoxamine 5-phosphate oxidase-related FMN-binding [Acidimicrobiales bacterium]|nr:pyridoxamine 5-phosphate oxidase-related FMN-binding [Acidimicrobiales bacterium]
MYTQPVDHEPLAWVEVEAQLEAALVYWVAVGGSADPHPRPVWGVWADGALLLSLGSPPLRRAIADGAPVAVHLESGTDVVIVNGTAAPDGSARTVELFLAAYQAKYDWTYQVDAFGPPTRVRPNEVLAWRALGAGGRNGFGASGKWSWV